MLAKSTSGETSVPATTTTTTTCRTSPPGSSPTTGAPSPSDLPGGAAPGKNYTTFSHQLGGCRKEGGEKLYDDGEIDDVLQEVKHEDDAGVVGAGARLLMPTDSTEQRGKEHRQQFHQVVCEPSGKHAGRVCSLSL